jgi:hypothetical protein
MQISMDDLLETCPDCQGKSKRNPFQPLRHVAPGILGTGAASTHGDCNTCQNEGKVPTASGAAPLAFIAHAKRTNLI